MEPWRPRAGGGRHRVILLGAYILTMFRPLLALLLRHVHPTYAEVAACIPEQAFAGSILMGPPTRSDGILTGPTMASPVLSTKSSISITTRLDLLRRYRALLLPCDSVRYCRSRKSGRYLYTEFRETPANLEISATV